MSVGPHIKEVNDKSDHSGSSDSIPEALVLNELARILGSRYFKTSLRSREFLEHIVHRKLQGHSVELKERTIGIELFHRSHDYSTGEDPIVRVQAGEVRRRLEQFYQNDTGFSQLHIELTAGSYAPHFKLSRLDPAVADEFGHNAAKNAGVFFSRFQTRRFSIGALVIAIAALAASAYLWMGMQKQAKEKSEIEQFWGPALASQQPELICLAKPVLYRPSLGLYRRYSATHPNTFRTEVERSNQILPLDPEARLSWNEMVPYSEYGVALGDVEAAVSISSLLGKFGKPTQVRIGDLYRFEDLHASPSTLIGAFNNKWTMGVTERLHFRLVEDDGKYSIREDIPGGRVWVSKFDNAQNAEQDYAIVARLLDSNTGQFTIVAAGLLGSGTQAASEFVSKPQFLEKALHELPAGWQNKNVEFVVQTQITDTVAGPPSVVAYYLW